METRICGKCKKEVVRIKSERRSNPRKGFHYRCDRGRLWSGKSCPQCHVPATKYYARAEKEDGTEVGGFELKKKSKRLCRECGKPLDTDRYFKHKSCDYFYMRSEYLESVWTGEEYGGSYCHNGSGY